MDEKVRLEEWKVLERIKISYLKHRGQTLDIAEETNLPIEYVKKQVEKIEKKESRDVSTRIANNLTSIILQGIQSRTIRFMEELKSLEGREQNLLSACCSYPVRESIVDNLTLYTCLKCDKQCNAVLADKITIYEMKNQILVQLREEDRFIIEMAERMGYTNKPIEGPSTIIQVKQQNLVLNTDEDKKIAADYSQLKPMDRELLIEKLRKEILKIDEQIKREETTPAGDSNPLR
jgi:hypothetical protein